MAEVVLYTTMTCGYCMRAKQLLKAKGQAFKEINVGFNPKERENMIRKANGARTVPQIFINNKHIGGCDELYALERAGKLDPMLG